MAFILSVTRVRDMMGSLIKLWPGIVFITFLMTRYRSWFSSPAEDQIHWCLRSAWFDPPRSGSDCQGRWCSGRWRGKQPWWYVQFRMKSRLPLTTGVLSCGLGGVDVVRLLAGAVRAGLNCLRVGDDTHSTDLRGHNYNISLEHWEHWEYWNLPRYCWLPAAWWEEWGWRWHRAVCWDW